mmetsp:Transcript_14131/g.50775  ORF Transcript_14131/g.50775 Transcript_14131/m.50775 type:complete len:305 (-) Transcript_14131:459-1373(-)
MPSARERGVLRRDPPPSRAAPPRRRLRRGREEKLPGRRGERDRVAGGGGGGRRRRRRAVDALRRGRRRPVRDSHRAGGPRELARGAPERLARHRVVVERAEPAERASRRVERGLPIALEGRRARRDKLKEGRGGIGFGIGRLPRLLLLLLLLRSLRLSHRLSRQRAWRRPILAHARRYQHVPARGGDLLAVVRVLRRRRDRGVVVALVAPQRERVPVHVQVVPQPALPQLRHELLEQPRASQPARDDDDAAGGDVRRDRARKRRAVLGEVQRVRGDDQPVTIRLVGEIRGHVVPVERDNGHVAG